MLKNPKRKGSRNELKAKKILEAARYFVVKAGGSLGLFDLVAVGIGRVVLVQVKSNRKPSKTEMRALKNFPAGYGKKEVWIFHDRKTAIETVEV